MSRHVPQALRERLFARSQGTCERSGCDAAITLESMHCAHLRAHVHGGPPIEENLAAWCPKCNLINGARDVTDPRTPARAWQLEALDVVVPKILNTGAATLSAAPAAGKTIFAGLVFMRLAELGFVNRMIVLVPRNTLVKQWGNSMLKHLHLQLRPDSAYERSGQVGVVVTYQSLQNRIARDNHIDQVGKHRTLLVLDEVHHVGEPVRPGGALPAWSRYVSELAGTVDVKLNVAAILNLSGTLWRSLPGQRISTIRYQTLPDGKLLSLVDYDIDAPRLIKEGHLRNIDLAKLGASVQLQDYRDLRVIDSHTADLNEKPAGRAVLRGLAKNSEWRRTFVGAVLDRLTQQHRSLQGHHVKALIVANSQASAALLCETANELMRERGLAPLARTATSDLADAQEVLEEFRTKRQPGILCTVDMAGEGYDCPDICVVGFASNKQTPLYIRQVVARAQRRTERERELNIPVPAVVVAPAVPELLELLAGILAPMHHEIAPAEAFEPREPRDPGDGSRDPAFELTQVMPDPDFNASIVEDDEWQVPGRTVRHAERALDEVGLPPIYATRTVYALMKAAQAQREAAPFDPLNSFEASFEQLGRSGTTPRADAKARSMSVEEKVALYRGLLKRAAGWWMFKGDPTISIEDFNTDANKAARIPPGGREDARVEQLQTAARFAARRILIYCRDHKMTPPNFREWME
jgi:superfamily II DNA or RNA helicase